MLDKASFNQELEIIDVESYGVVTKEDILGSIEMIQRLQEANGISKLLIDTTKQDVLPNPIEIFEIFSVYPREIRTALLTQKIQSTAKERELVETVAVNRGKRSEYAISASRRSSG